MYSDIGRINRMKIEARCSKPTGCQIMTGEKTNSILEARNVGN